ncbi:ATP-binding cassette sub-family C member 9-like protein, partial [Leptotrombidium deliense]
SVSFAIKSGEKVAVCGRTGSGKSSLVMALFKLVPKIDGQIMIDDIDLDTVDSTTLRNRLSVVPQDTVLFSGTIRENLDPGNEYSDSSIWNVLRLCKLETVFASLSDTISDDGSNLSTGKRQLVCLARALIKNRSLLIMDEATSSLDSESEQFINNIISSTKQTVISVIHRVSSVLNFDKVIVLQSGVIQEIGSPKELVSKKNSLFNSLLKGEQEYTER